MAREFLASITEVIRRTYNVKSFRFSLPEMVEFMPGQYLLVTLEINGQRLIKGLSISSSPTENEYVEFTKKLTQSDFSKKLDGLKAGDKIQVKLPLGKFTFSGEYPKIAFLSGGIGITPIRSICKFSADKRLAASIILVYSNSAPQDIAFKDDFDAMQKQNPSLKVIHTITVPQEAGNLGYLRGYINKEMIQQVILDYAQRKFYL